MGDTVSSEGILAVRLGGAGYVKAARAQAGVLDREELAQVQRDKRSEFEGYLKRNRLDMGEWLRYAQFEVEQADYRRARSVFERALAVDMAHVPLWVRYIDVELKGKYVNHARNLLFRAVTVLPRVSKLWFKYLYVEEALGNVDAVRSLYLQWISLEPPVEAWESFVEFEVRHQEFSNVRDVFLRFVLVHPQAQVWRQWIEFETKYGDTGDIRKVYTLAADTLVASEASIGEFEDDTVSLVVAFANWEASVNEMARSQAIYNLALAKWPQNEFLKDSLVVFDKIYSNTTSIGDGVLLKRKRHYKTSLQDTPRDYDIWWSYLDLLEDYYPQELQDALLDAVSDRCMPLQRTDKTLEWSRYVELWTRLLVHLELRTNEIELCRAQYKKLCFEVIPNKNFTYFEIWVRFAQFEIRQDRLDSGRKILGYALGTCPTHELFKQYIELEIKLREFDRVRKLYEKFIEFEPDNVSIWIDYAELEENLGDLKRSRGIYLLAMNSEVDTLTKASKMDLLKRFIEFELENNNYNNAREVYELYLKFTNYSISSWKEFANFEMATPTDEQYEMLRKDAQGSDSEDEFEFEHTEENIVNARAIYEKALDHFKKEKNDEARNSIMLALQEFEQQNGDEYTQLSIEKRLPNITKKTVSENGIEREVIVMNFPDDTQQKPNVLRLLKLAREWNQVQD